MGKYSGYILLGLQTMQRYPVSVEWLYTSDLKMSNRSVVFLHRGSAPKPQNLKTGTLDTLRLSDYAVSEPQRRSRNLKNRTPMYGNAEPRFFVSYTVSISMSMERKRCRKSGMDSQNQRMALCACYSQTLSKMMAKMFLSGVLADFVIAIYHFGNWLLIGLF